MGIVTNEHGDEVDDDWEPGNDALKGADPGTLLAVPQHEKPPQDRTDELSHRARVALGLDNNDPDPGYDPDADDLDDPL